MSGRALRGSPRRAWRTRGGVGTRNTAVVNDTRMRKISRVTGTMEAPEEHEFVYEDTYAVERNPDNRQCLRIGARSNLIELVLDLIARLRAPFEFLLVLHTSRTGAALGRYQSPDQHRLRRNRASQLAIVDRARRDR